MLIKMVCMWLIDPEQRRSRQTENYSKTKHQLMFKILTWCLWKENSVNNQRSDECPEVTEQSCSPCDSLQLISCWGHSVAWPWVAFIHRLSASQHRWLLSGKLLDHEIFPQRSSPWGIFNLLLASSSSSKVRISWERVLLQPLKPPF